MSEWLSTLDQHWFWLSLGLILGAIEMLAPGFFLMWLGLAAIIVGLLSWLVPGMIIPMQVALFAVLSVLTVYAGKRFLKDNPIESDDPALNDKGARLTGEIVTVVEAIENGRGRVRVGDSEWNARGADAAIGARVRVTGADGAVLLVEGV
ncbi:NfeD family protein [Sphingorhabdus sp.]|jgi:membrane protein implicated in regulation of membrane protease activity|uniref:NfeD family protein n=1 Tax=Sphingorhabdus sp. TaxID=1902408 RepID=UPI003BB1D6C0|nr:NfeD family protein [Sphingomonadales bacterium]MBK9433553.1 NfeD family protein [Sphingomonadales bacterium]MBL0021778.1 NfeD family protein [Sphingomonadales bacterium]